MDYIVEFSYYIQNESVSGKALVKGFSRMDAEKTFKKNIDREKYNDVQVINVESLSTAYKKSGMIILC